MTGRVPGNCGRDILVDNKVRERREWVPVLALVSHTLTTHHSTTPEKDTPFWDLINTLIVCLTLSIHIFSNLPCSWWYPHCKCLCVYVYMYAYIKHDIKCFICVSINRFIKLCVFFFNILHTEFYELYGDALASPEAVALWRWNKCSSCKWDMPITTIMLMGCPPVKHPLRVFHETPGS